MYPPRVTGQRIQPSSERHRVRSDKGHRGRKGTTGSGKGRSGTWCNVERSQRAAGATVVSRAEENRRRTAEPQFPPEWNADNILSENVGNAKLPAAEIMW